ncbi:hypothetical protein N7509_003870 [Penicillium cosmopolitanum]|uniref:Peptidase S8/S53 domain-containing protein n=1 Tax=Penicillium cosmopolitanum TaxID=1131564 RepID=A0A9W9W5Q0_9EURO|nr:uncharacterized protein N7509_003870 [Penicillium cosmopolitanum]KAJ5403999.1 hypothetical protein N7509_003870 [Penicillium cosmopolitanum]
MEKENKRRRIERRASRTSQKGAPDHLKFVSQPSGSPYDTAGKEAGYNYFDSAGEGTRVYIVDSGLAQDHEEFNEVQGDIGWIYGRPDSQAAENDFDDKRAHGTCMASCAVGRKDGVAKKASLTAVRVYREDDLAFERLIDALAQVYDDIIKRNLQGKAVISMSIGQFSITTDAYKDYMAAVEDAMAALTNGVIDGLDGAVVVAAGQDNTLAPDNQPAQLPATLVEQKCPKMIIVGGVDLTGAVADGTLEYKAGTTIDTMIWGPAEDVQCAIQNGYADDVSGTSPATAMTAGLIAYFMGEGNTGSEARELIFEHAYVRTPKSERTKRGMRNAISNGVECS